jgi:hypothetical protein
MVSAERSKELQNVLPKCNPLPIRINYYIYRAVGLRRASTASCPAHLNNNINRCKCDKNRAVATATITTFATFSTYLRRSTKESPSGGFIHLAKGFILWQIGTKPANSLSDTDDIDDSDDITDIDKLIANRQMPFRI